MSTGERSKLFREKQKQENPEDWKEKCNERRKKNLDSLSKEQTDEFKKKDRERKKARKEEAKLN